MSAVSNVENAQAGERLRRAHARDAAATLVAELHRLVKLAQIHALENQAVVRQLESTRHAVREYTLRAGEPATIFFARGLVFIGSEPLKGSRGAYEAAAELAAVLARAGGNELVFAPEIATTDLRAFVEGLVASMRGGRYVDGPRIRLRSVSEALARGLEIERVDAEQRIVRTYASAVVVMRRFFEALGGGELAMPRRIKRIAQDLVDLSNGQTPIFLGVTAARNANHDEAGRAVNTAILSVAMARKITSDPVVLARLAMSALMFDAGRLHARRAMQMEGDEAPIVARLSDAAERTLPATTAAVLTALGRVNEPTMVRTVVAFEALSVAKNGLPREPLYRGVRPATLHARIVAIARAYNDLLTCEPGEQQRTPSEVIVALEENADAADRTAIRLLQAALGIVPAGTMLELSTGEIGVVLASEGTAPRLRIVVDASGAMPATPVELVLGSDTPTAVRIVGTDPSFAAQRPALTPAPTPSHVSVVTKPPPEVAIVAMPAPVIAHDVDATIVERSPFEMEQTPSPPESVAPVSSTPKPVARVALVRRSTIPPMKAPPAARRAPPESARPSPAGLDVPSRAAEVQGSLARSPLPHLLVHVLNRGLSGSLILRETESTAHAIVFREGAPVKAHAVLRGPRLGDLLVARGDVSSSALPDVVLRARTAGRPLGKQLVAEGKASAAQIGSALEEQLDARLAELTTLSAETAYSFYEGHDALPAREAYSFDPLARILVTARSYRDDASIDAAITRIGETPIALHPAAMLDRFRPTEEERVAIEWAVAGGFSYRALLAEEIAAPEAVRAIVWSLLATRHIDVGAGHPPLGVRPPVAPALPPEEDSGRHSFTSLPAPAEGLPSALIIPTATPKIELASAMDVKITEAEDPRRQTILDRAASLGSLDAYALLGVDERADEVAIQRAYFEAVKTFHPDRLPSALADVKDEAARVFTALTEAHKTLMDPEKRKAHDAARTEGIAPFGEKSEVERVLEASTNFEKAMIMLRRSDFDAAERYAALAAEGDPNMAEHLALYGYLLSMKGGPDPTARAVELLDRAASDPDPSDRVLYWRGSVRKKLGQLDAAIVDFRAAADKNPKNIDAAREVRLWEMRAAKRQEAKKSLLSGWFGRRRD